MAAKFLRGSMLKPAIIARIALTIGIAALKHWAEEADRAREFSEAFYNRVSEGNKDYLKTKKHYLLYKASRTNERKSICYTTPGDKKCRNYRLHEDKFLEEKIDALEHQNRNMLTAELNLLSKQVGKIQEELFAKPRKG